MFGLNKSIEDQDDEFLKAGTSSFMHQRSTKNTQVYGESIVGTMEQILEKKYKLDAQEIEKDPDEQMYYVQKFMSRQTDSQAYLESVKKDAPLKELFRVVKDCYEDQNLPVCPVLVEIQCEELIKAYGGKYLI